MVKVRDDPSLPDVCALVLEVEKQEKRSEKMAAKKLLKWQARANLDLAIPKTHDDLVSIGRTPTSNPSKYTKSAPAPPP